MLYKAVLYYAGVYFTTLCLSVSRPRLSCQTLAMKHYASRKPGRRIDRETGRKQKAENEREREREREREGERERGREGERERREKERERKRERERDRETVRQ